MGLLEISFPKKTLRANKENKEKFLKIKNDLIKKNDETIEESKKILKKSKKKKLFLLEMQVIMANFTDQSLLKISQIISKMKN